MDRADVGRGRARLRRNSAHPEADRLQQRASSDIGYPGGEGHEVFTGQGLLGNGTRVQHVDGPVWACYDRLCPNERL